MGIKTIATRALYAAGLQLRRIPTEDQRISESIVHRPVKLMKNRGIGLVLDVGANRGQFGKLLRQLGFRGRIVSFEPLKDAFATLRRLTANDPLWECHNLALGDSDRTASINISANSYSSSFLPVSARSVQI